LGAPTICLAMIVRDEAHVLQRCLESVIPVIDHWIIVDTGSTDSTREVVRGCLGGVPGHLVERPWVSFGHNRTEAITLARAEADYVLVIDADEVLHVEPGYTTVALEGDAYNLESRYGALRYARTQLLKSALPWRYVGAVHEYPESDGVTVAPRELDGLWVEVLHDGARACDPQTYRRDALLLEHALLDEPDDPRTTFYLAQSYRDAGDLELALRQYRARARLGGWQDEVWYSLYQVGRIREAIGTPWASVLDDYLTAYRSQPARAEPLYRIGARYADAGSDEVARLFLAPAMEIARPDWSHLFVERDVYDYLLPLVFAQVSGRQGRHDTAIDICNELIRQGLTAEQLSEVQRCRRDGLARRRPATMAMDADARIRICIPVAEAVCDAAECLESISLLDPAPHDVCIVADGVELPRLDVSILGEIHVQVIRSEQPVGFDACVERFVAQRCAPSDVIIPIPPTNRFASRSVLRSVRAAFLDARCVVVVGQHRRAGGRLGDAEPAIDESDLMLNGRTRASHSPIIFRAGAEGPEPRSPELFLDRVLQGAGVDGTCFTDEVLTARNAHGPVRPARPPTEVPRSASSVSCLMVTHDRLGLAKRAIACFASQSYANRELVVLTDGTPAARRCLEHFVEEMEVPNVELVVVEESGRSLGVLRNLAVAAASGDVLCQWDDDDCSHPDRIAVQLQRLHEGGGRACLLTDHLQFLEDERALVWVDWTIAGRTGRDQLLPGTIMMFKDERFRYPEAGPFAYRGEDTMLLNDLCDEVPIVSLRGEGHLYLYTYHGRNTFDREHHHRLARSSLTARELEVRRQVILSAMRHYPVPRPYAVIGRDGPAFTVNE
jgi:glycosyltransferase involved in cell wall biosynthesis